MFISPSSVYFSECHFNQVHTAYTAGQCVPANAQVGSQAHVVVVAREPSCVSAYGGAYPTNSGRQQQNNIPGAHTASLLQYLKAGFDAGLPASWHRNEERQGRSLSHVRTPANLEDWERELVWIEILQLSDCSEDDCFTHLARAWGVDDLAQLLVSDPRTTTEERCVLATCSSMEQFRSPQTILSMPAADNHQVSGDFDKRFPGQYPFFLDLERQVDA